MNELTATYQQNTTGLPEAFRTMDTGSEKSPGKTNGCFFQGLDYYPYGMEMPGRTFTAQIYRYAYQGSEQAPEYNSAGGNVYTTFFRTLDSRLGRWFTPDVVSQPWQSPYCSMDNNPVALVDPWGAQSEEGENSFGEPILDYEFQSGPTSRIDQEGYIHTVERKGGVTYDVMYKVGNENDKIYFHLKMEINDEVNISQSDNNEVEKPYYTPDQGFAWYSERGINGDNPYADVWRYLDFDLLEIFNLVYSKISKLKISRTKKTKNTKNSKESKTTNKTLEETKRTTGRSKERQPSITKKEPATTTVVEEKIENTNRQVHNNMVKDPIDLIPKGEGGAGHSAIKSKTIDSTGLIPKDSSTNYYHYILERYPDTVFTKKRKND